MGIPKLGTLFPGWYCVSKKLVTPTPPPPSLVRGALQTPGLRVQAPHPLTLERLGLLLDMVTNLRLLFLMGLTLSSHSHAEPPAVLYEHL